jgi:hypothetical protein
MFILLHQRVLDRARSSFSSEVSVEWESFGLFHSEQEAQHQIEVTMQEIRRRGADDHWFIIPAEGTQWITEDDFGHSE